MTMHNFTRALSEYFDGPPVRPQNEFADRARIHRSKVCRLLKGTITCDRNTLDLILNAVSDAAARRKLVMAYINDYCSPGALLHLKADNMVSGRVSTSTPQPKGHGCPQGSARRPERERLREGPGRPPGSSGLTKPAPSPSKAVLAALPLEPPSCCVDSTQAPKPCYPSEVSCKNRDLSSIV